MNITMEDLMEVKKELMDTLNKVDKVHQEIGDIKTSLKNQIKEMEKKINNLSEFDGRIKEVQNTPIIYYRKIKYASSEEAYFWYGRDWAENNPQKVQKYYGKDLEVFHVPHPIDRLDQFNYTSLHEKVERIVENNELISDYVWIDYDDVLLFPDKPNNVFSFDIFVEEMLKEGIRFVPEPEFFRQ